MSSSVTCCLLHVDVCINNLRSCMRSQYLFSIAVLAQLSLLVICLFPRQLLTLFWQVLDDLDGPLLVVLRHWHHVWFRADASSAVRSGCLFYISLFND